MKIARLGTAFLFAIGSYGLTTLPVAAASMPNNAAQAPDPAAATVAAPQWRVGSWWEFSDGYGIRVDDVKDGVTRFQRLDAPEQWFSMRGFLRQDAASGTSERETIYRTTAPESGTALRASAPLTFQREYLSNGNLIVHAASWSVEGRERITVPAGTFDCWVIVWRERSLKSNWTGFERWWYSPEAQQYVRMEYKYGPTETASRVLMRYKLASDPRSVPVAMSVAPARIEVPPTPVAPETPNDLDRTPVILPPKPDRPSREPDAALAPISRDEGNDSAAAEASEAESGSPGDLVNQDVVFITMPGKIVHEPELRTIALDKPLVMTLDVIPVSEVAVEADPAPEPALRTIALDKPLVMALDTVPISEVAVDSPVLAGMDIDTQSLTAAVLADAAWSTDRIDDLRARIEPYYEPANALPAPEPIAVESASGPGSPFGFLVRLIDRIVDFFG